MKRLRTRLALATGAVALLPALPLSVLVHGLLERAFAPPYLAEVETALEDALAADRARLQDAKAELARWAREEWRPDVPPAAPPPPEVARWAGGRAAEGPGIVGPERVGAWLAVAAPGKGPGGAPAVAFRPLPEGLAARAERAAGTLGLLRGLRGQRPTVLRGFVLPFLLAYAGLLAIAIATGTWLARRIVRPVEALAEGARRVGAGEPDVRVDVAASGEVGELVDAFHRMVDDLGRQRAELARLERVAAQRDLARTLAHEIKNPLTPIQLAVQQLAERAPADDPAYGALVTECRAIVDEEVAALRRLVREFSEFARLPEPRPVPGDLGALVADVGRLYGERVVPAGEEAVPALFDEAELKRALLNLVDNGLAACAAAGRPERVRVATAREGDAAVLRVADEGCGMGADELARVFEADFSTKAGGTGLGLAIVDGIVRGHRGTIAVESERGRGTVFEIRLPATEEGR